MSWRCKRNIILKNWSKYLKRWNNCGFQDFERFSKNLKTWNNYHFQCFEKLSFHVVCKKLSSDTKYSIGTLAFSESTVVICGFWHYVMWLALNEIVPYGPTPSIRLYQLKHKIASNLSSRLLPAKWGHEVIKLTCLACM